MRWQICDIINLSRNICINIIVQGPNSSICNRGVINITKVHTKSNYIFLHLITSSIYVNLRKCQKDMAKLSKNHLYFNIDFEVPSEISIIFYK